MTTRGRHGRRWGAAALGGGGCGPGGRRRVEDDDDAAGFEEGKVFGGCADAGAVGVADDDRGRVAGRGVPTRARPSCGRMEPSP